MTLAYRVLTVANPKDESTLSSILTGGPLVEI